MGKLGLKIAKLFGTTLDTFSNQIDAEKELYEFRDLRLNKLNDLARLSATFDADGSPESLKEIEKWYFELWENNEFGQIGVDRKEFEECFAMYFGRVFVENNVDWHWIVSEFAFQRGKYELGISNVSVSIMLSRFTDHFDVPNNKRRQSIWRKYRKYCD